LGWLCICVPVVGNDTDSELANFDVCPKAISPLRARNKTPAEGLSENGKLEKTEFSSGIDGQYFLYLAADQTEF
jgi:hypothetical protein